MTAPKPEVRTALLKLGAAPETETAQEFAAFIADEARRWAAVARGTRIRMDCGRGSTGRRYGRRGSGRQVPVIKFYFRSGFRRAPEIP